MKLIAVNTPPASKGDSPRGVRNNRTPGSNVNHLLTYRRSADFHNLPFLLTLSLSLFVPLGRLHNPAGRIVSKAVASFSFIDTIKLIQGDY